MGFFRLFLSNSPFLSCALGFSISMSHSLAFSILSIARLFLSSCLSNLSISFSLSLSQSLEINQKNISETATEQKRGRHFLPPCIWLTVALIASFAFDLSIGIEKPAVVAATSRCRHYHHQPQKSARFQYYVFFLLSHFQVNTFMVSTWIVLLWNKIGLGFVVTRRCASISNLEFCHRY